MKAEQELAKEDKLKSMLEERQLARQQGGSYVPTILPCPRTPTDMERWIHDLTHLPYEAWCEFCVMAKSNDHPHRTRTFEDIDKHDPELQLDYMFIDSECRTCPKSGAWTTVLTGVDCDSDDPFH